MVFSLSGGMGANWVHECGIDWSWPAMGDICFLVRYVYILLCIGRRRKFLD